MRFLTHAPRAVRQHARMLAFTGLVAVFGVAGIARKMALSDQDTQIRRLQEAEGEGTCGGLKHWEHQYGLVVYGIALLYLFISLATVCDEYFVDVLERITEKLGLSPDVAGATFMAAGSSAPELFVSLADNVLTKPKESMGVGAIVGSAIFNILIIISFSSFFAGQVLHLDWRPLVRDSLWYCYAILLLTYFIWDGKVETWEAGVLFVSYILYCCYMSINEWVISKLCKRPEIDVDEEDGKSDQLVNNDVSVQVDAPNIAVQALVAHAAQRFKAKGKKVYVPELNPMLTPEFRHILSHRYSSDRFSHTGETPGAGQAAVPGTIPEGSGEEGEEVLGPYFSSLYTVPKGVAGKIWFVLTWPIVVLLRITVPDTRYPQFSGTGGLIGSFVMSILWICGLSNFTVQWATKVGCLLSIPSTVMGLTIVAMGTSVPDALSSILVARSGKGDMAVSNAIGSNCFDILCGLGLPFFLSTLIYHEAAAVVVDDLQTSIFMLFGVLVTVIILLGISKWRLHPIVGGIMAVMYVLYVVYSYLHEAKH